MKSSLTPVLGLGALLALNSCYVWQPPAPQQPNGPSRYMAVDQGGVQQPVPNQPGAVGPAAPSPYGEPSATIPTTDPAAVVVPNPNAPVPPPTDSTGGSNSSVGAPTTPPPTSPPPPPTAPTTPYGVKVPGKPGFVYSPFDKTAGVVDVQGMAPGTKVKCPYTGKVFIVP